MNHTEIANKYIAVGFSLLPTTKDKCPATKAWIGVNIPIEEFTDCHGIGVKCGQASGGLECIDIDNHFFDAKQVLSDFIQIEEVRAIYDKYKLPIQSTTSGGFHLLYRCSVIEGNQKLASRPKYDNTAKRYKKDVLIETRGEGGYFCVDPTPGYKFVKNSISKIANITPDEREILLSGCKSFNTYAEVKQRTEENKDLPGNRFNNDPSSVNEMQKALRGAGWTEPRDGLWLRPGKKKGISATLGKVAPGIFYNFSTSSDPFEDNKAYTAFQVITLLEYNGDFSLYAKELSKKYGNDIEVKVKKEEPKTANQIDEIIRKCYIDTEVPVAKPPVIMRMKIKHGFNPDYTRVFTLGNFSAIIGKSKAKKTYLATMLMACAIRGGEMDNTIKSDLPSGRPGVVIFDTEQSNYDAYISAKRVCDLAKINTERFGSFDLREFTPIERCNIIDRFIEKRSYGVSFIVIDGIADLATAINDEIEASRVVSLLMKWTKVHNLHICVVIHQNKNDNYATGHLGSAIMKKSECVISVTKDTTDSYKSEISCDYIRGAMEFDKFCIVIDQYGMPSVDPVFIANNSNEPTFYK